jgi:hypothetical protein
VIANEGVALPDRRTLRVQRLLCHGRVITSFSSPGAALTAVCRGCCARCGSTAVRSQD